MELSITVYLDIFEGRRNEMSSFVLAYLDEEDDRCQQQNTEGYNRRNYQEGGQFNGIYIFFYF